MNTINPRIAALGILALALAPASAQKFYPDDPLTKEPPPFQTTEATYRALNELLEMFTNVFQETGERHPSGGVIPAIGTNTLGEVLDGAWFVDRHARRRLTPEELTRGPGNQDAPATDQPWRVLTVKKYDVRPGLLIADSKNDVYLLRFDPPRRLEMSTGAGMIGSRLYHALGYWVAENYLVYFRRPQLVASPEGEDFNAVGEARQLMEEDIDLFLEKVPEDRRRGYRAVAIKMPENSELLGPYQFFGTRSDDPNDIVAHEHRRDLRGLHLISAWTGNNWISATQNQDALMEENDVYYIRHYVVEFFTTLGSGFMQEKHAREGYEPLFDLGLAAKNFVGLGIYSPKWQRARYPKTRSVGRFEAQAFDPATWTPNYDVAALANHLPDDDYWAAKKIMAFTDEDIRTIVKVAEYSDPTAEDWIASALIERRDKILRHAFEQVLPLDSLRVEGGRLVFDDLAVRSGFRGEQPHTVKWSEFRNFTKEHVPILGQSDTEIPERIREAQPDSYYAANITGETAGMSVTVYLHKEPSGLKVVGVDRDWPGKVIAEERQPPQALESRYTSLAPRQKELFDAFTARYNERTGFDLTPEEAFRALSLSERTTFDGVTHALSRSELSDAEGNSLGNALDLITGIERIAGQYYGRQGDEMFRLYCFLREDAREVIEKSAQFSRSHDNTVYHAGYPTSFRQEGKVPNIQFSMSEDELKADVDVDYRSSKIPQAMWNGHLTAANSDIRAGDNYKHHNHRWAGLANWWTRLFGKVPAEEESSTNLLAQEPPEPPTPLPPDRPIDARVDHAYEATQEFLTDWLVHRKYDEAMAWIPDDAMACVNLDDDSDEESLTAADIRRRLPGIMNAVAEEMGKFENLTQAIDAVMPWEKAFRAVSHPFEGDFALVEVPDSFADAFRCASRSVEAQNRALASSDLRYGTYYGAVFRFKQANSRGGALGLLWAKESGAWRLVAWEVFDP